MIKNDSAAPRTTFQVYPHWDTKVPPLPLRSRLFRLEPIGMGSPDVECLTSYISRVAAEHCVSPLSLFYREILDSAGNAIVHYSTTTRISTRLINGMGRLAELTAGTVERLTLRNDLRHMTMLGWKDVLSNHLLFRTGKAWCPACYEMWMNEGRLIYDPLIWSFTIISLCPRHHEPLCRICPHCGRTSPFLTTFSYPGFCSICRMWLGAPGKGKRQGNKTLVNSSEKVIQISEVYAIGELLLCTGIFNSSPTLRDLTTNLVECVERRANGSINVFSNLVGIWSGTIRRLLAGKTKLSLKMLSQLCSRLNISPYEILTNRGNKETFKERSLTVKQDTLHLSAKTNFKKIHRAQIKQPQVKRVVPWDQAEIEFLAAREENPPPSLEAISKRLGWLPSTVKRRFPEQCELIVSRYWEYRNNRHPPPIKVQATLRKALREQPPPSLQCVLRRLGCQDTGSYYYTNYLSLCLAVSRRYKTYRNHPFRMEADSKYLNNMLSEYPPLSFSEIARRLRHTREFVRRKFPELSKAIVSQYLQHQAALRKEAAHRLHHAITVAAQEIMGSGQYVSEAKIREHVRRHLPKIGRDSLFKQALREVKLELGLTK